MKTTHKTPEKSLNRLFFLLNYLSIPIYLTSMLLFAVSIAYFIIIVSMPVGTLNGVQIFGFDYNIEFVVISILISIAIHTCFNIQVEELSRSINLPFNGFKKKKSGSSYNKKILSPYYDIPERMNFSGSFENRLVNIFAPKISFLDVATYEFNFLYKNDKDVSYFRIDRKEHGKNKKMTENFYFIEFKADCDQSFTIIPSVSNGNESSITDRFNRGDECIETDSIAFNDSYKIWINKNDEMQFRKNFGSSALVYFLENIASDELAAIRVNNGRALAMVRKPIFAPKKFLVFFLKSKDKNTLLLNVNDLMIDKIQKLIKKIK